jgi:hypothetical protein
MPGRGERVYEFWVNQPLSTAFVMNSKRWLGARELTAAVADDHFP